MPRNSFLLLQGIAGIIPPTWRLDIYPRMFEDCGCGYTYLYLNAHTQYIYIYILDVYRCHCHCNCNHKYAISTVHILTEISGRSFHTSQMLGGNSLMNAFWCCFRLWKLMQWPKQTANITPPYPQCISSWMRLRMPSTSQRFSNFKISLPISLARRTLKMFISCWVRSPCSFPQLFGRGVPPGVRLFLLLQPPGARKDWVVVDGGWSWASGYATGFLPGYIYI